MMWKKIHAADIPLQNNLNDCGVFVCTYGEYLSRNSKLNFSPKDMVSIELKMLTDILTGQLSYSNKFAVNNPTDMKATKIIADSQIIKHDKKKVVITEIPGVRVYQSASFHQGTETVFKHPRANSQCTAISAYAILSLPSIIEDVTSEVLDNILVEGDKYYLQCLCNQRQTSHNYLNVSELVRNIQIKGKDVTFEIDDMYDGSFISPTLFKELSQFLVGCIQNFKDTAETCGFRFFFGNSKTVSFKIYKIPEPTFFMFNSHSVDINNKTKMPELG